MYLFFAAIGIVISILVFFKYMMAGAYEGVAILAIFYLVALGVILLQAQEGKGRASSYILALPPVATIVLVILITTFADITRCGCFGLFGYASWKEEVLLHDGSKVIARRWQKGRHRYSYERSSFVSKQSISFRHPKTGKRIVWKDGPTKAIRNVNFDLIALHIKEEIPYLITQAYDCFSYNWWGRPNPPYVIFKYEDKTWKRIPLEELPPEFENVNLMMSIDKKEIPRWLGVISAKTIRKSNDSFYQRLFYRSIVRTPMEFVGCEVLVTDGRGRWSGFGVPDTYEACLDKCKKVSIRLAFCPCDQLFNKTTKGE